MTRLEKQIEALEWVMGQHTGKFFASRDIQEQIVRVYTTLQAVRPLYVASARVYNHWCEFGPEHGFDEAIDGMAKELDKLSATIYGPAEELRP